jgi:hypothetical protein
MKITNEIGKAVKSLNDSIAEHKQTSRVALEEVVQEEYNEAVNEATDSLNTLLAKIAVEKAAQTALMARTKADGLEQIQTDIIDADDTGLIAIANAFVQADEDLDSALEDSQSTKVSRWDARIALEGDYGTDFLSGWNSVG